mmetsp:Transcript_4981/g.10737  ORF Transcript_4981/g.10737 Transcript_4981/m.10737 type:complete len:131 (+) Transcript_4981:282-674(+)
MWNIQAQKFTCIHASAYCIYNHPYAHVQYCTCLRQQDAKSTHMMQPRVAQAAKLLPWHVQALGAHACVFHITAPSLIVAHHSRQQQEPTWKPCMVHHSTRKLAQQLHIPLQPSACPTCLLLKCTLTIKVK